MYIYIYVLYICIIYIICTIYIYICICDSVCVGGWVKTYCYHIWVYNGIAIQLCYD